MSQAWQGNKDLRRMQRSIRTRSL